MGFTRTLYFNTTILAAAAAAGGWAFWTRNSKFVPMSSSDLIFTSSSYLRNNPNRNPVMQDLCVRKVPLSKIKLDLLQREGKLFEAFCAGIWSGLGYVFQRSILSELYQNDTTTKHQLWSRPELKASTYDVGTQITDHFEVVSKTSEAIVVRCGESPLNTGLRDLDGLFEMGVTINKREGVAEFRLKTVFYKGQGTSIQKPLPSYAEFAHRLYTKLWMETAVQSVVM